MTAAVFRINVNRMSKRHSLVFLQRDDLPESGERPVDRLYAAPFPGVPPGHHLGGLLAGRRVFGPTAGALGGFGRTGFLAAARGRGRQRRARRRAGRAAYDRVLAVRIRQPIRLGVVVCECFCGETKKKKNKQ